MASHCLQLGFPIHSHDLCPRYTSPNCCMSLRKYSFKYWMACAIEHGHFKNQGGSLLLFPSLITQLYRRVRVEEYANILGCIQRTPFTLLRFGVKVHLVREKKGRSTQVSQQMRRHSFRPSIVGPFEEISVKTKVIRKLESWLPTGPGGAYTTCHSYVFLTDYKRFSVDQQEKMATIYRIDRAYQSLSQFIREIKESYDKKTKRDKLFTKIWKWLKGL